MDPYLWLEEVESDTSLDWARERNAESAARLAGERFETIESEVLQILDSDERIPSVRRRGEWLWNYWIDGEHPYGLWRRTTLASYRTDSPEWDVVIDLDELRERDGENWVWGGAAVLRGASPDGEPWDRALISLSRGAPTPPWSASSRSPAAPSSTTASHWRRRRAASPGSTPTRCTWAPTSDRARSPIRGTRGS
ncbi:hypothetical protein GCM10009551_066490 [Nocardiopsis tropica]